MISSAFINEDELKGVASESYDWLMVRCHVPPLDRALNEKYGNPLAIQLVLHQHFVSVAMRSWTTLMLSLFRAFATHWMF